MWTYDKTQHFCYVLLVVTITLLLPFSAFAQGRYDTFTVTPLYPESIFQGTVEKPLVSPKVYGSRLSQEGLVSVIVKLKGEPLVSYAGGIPGLAPTRPARFAAGIDVKSVESQVYLDHLAVKQSAFEGAVIKTIPQVQVTYRFDVILNAVAMRVPADQVKALTELPEVEAVYADELLHLDTNASPQFIGAPTVWSQLGGQESAGEGVIVGVLDTGIWPEHPSFSDPDPFGRPFSPPPPPNSGSRDCKFTGGANPGPVFTCNNKLIGAWRFMNSYEALISLLPDEFTTARDDDGHGTHTSSTAAGNARVAANIFGISRGRVSGIAPRAHVIMYKVCGADGCYSSDSAAAVQQAIKDGVNVINFSISGGSNPYSDVVSLAFLDAYNAGVFVAASAGNSGPGLETTDHREPWVTTVAASTQVRAFVNHARITADGGNTLVLNGASLTQGISTPRAVVVPASDPLCNGPFAAGTFTNQIVVCKRGVSGRVEKGYNVQQGGAVGMILYNNAPNVTDLETDNHFLPTTHIQYADGQALLSFLSSHTNGKATLSAGASAASKGDVIASFSSRGGPGQTLGVSKPDITAPGVQILAGHSPQHVNVAGGPDGELFQAIAGTSMSSPHVAGAAALLKDLHPDWTPGQIKSAIMMTAKTAGVFKEDGITFSDVFDRGSGRINLKNASRPRLTISAPGAEFVAHQNDLWNVNYPSLYIPAMPGLMTVERTVQSETPQTVYWNLWVQAPQDVKINVPSSLTLSYFGTSTFQITVDGRDVPIGEIRMATLYMSDGQNTLLHFPITFVRKQPIVNLTKSCDPANFPKGSSTACTISITNDSFSNANVSMIDNVPGRLKVIAGSVVGATSVSDNTVAFAGTLAAVEPPDVAIAAGTSPEGYLPLSLFGVPPIAGMGDETIVNFNVPPFTYAGETYTRVGVVSNGYIVVGGGTGADVNIINQNLPNPARPNNVLAPFWTDLNPSAGGAMRIATLTDGQDTWIVVDWNGVKEFSSAKLNTFEVWIGLNTDTHPGEDISYAYGTLQGNGDGGFLTVGAENKLGNRGANYYYNGAGSLPTNVTQLRVTGTPSVPGETHVITFQAKGLTTGPWTNYATMTSDLFGGTSIAPFSGTVLRP